MKHKYRNHYFLVLICIVFCLCIFLVRYAFSARTQTNASLPVTEVRQSFSFLNTIDSELSQLCDRDLNNTSFFQELQNRTNIHILAMTKGLEPYLFHIMKKLTTRG